MPRPRVQQLEIYWILQSILGCATGPQTTYEEISVGMVTLQSFRSWTEAALPVMHSCFEGFKWRQDVAQMSAAVVFKQLLPTPRRLDLQLASHAHISNAATRRIATF